MVTTLSLITTEEDHKWVPIEKKHVFAVSGKDKYSVVVSKGETSRIDATVFLAFLIHKPRKLIKAMMATT